MGLETDANLAQPFQLHRPRSMAETAELLGALTASGDEVVIMSGGQSLTVMLTSGLATPDHVVSLVHCRDLEGLTVSGDVVGIGARTTVAEIETDRVLASRAPALVKAASGVGSPHVRAFGTVVGNVCHADPGGDIVLPLLCYDAELRVEGAFGRRVVPVTGLMDGPYETSLRPGEFGVGIHFTPPDTKHQAYRKVVRRQGDLALASACAVLTRDGGVLGDVRIALGGLLGRAQRLTVLERALSGREWGPVAEREFFSAHLDDVWGELLDDPDDPGSAAYLKDLATSLIADVIFRAMNGVA